MLSHERGECCGTWGSDVCCKDVTTQRVSEEQGQLSDRTKAVRMGIADPERKPEGPRFSPTFANMLTKNLLGPDTPALRAFFWNAMNYQAKPDTMSSSEARKATAELSGGNTKRVGSEHRSSTTGEQP